MKIASIITMLEKGFPVDYQGVSYVPDFDGIVVSRDRFHARIPNAIVFSKSGPSIMSGVVYRLECLANIV